MTTQLGPVSDEQRVLHTYHRARDDASGDRGGLVELARSLIPSTVDNRVQGTHIPRKSPNAAKREVYDGRF
jgi:hypothetical protein